MYKRRLAPLLRSVLRSPRAYTQGEARNVPSPRAYMGGGRSFSKSQKLYRGPEPIWGDSLKFLKCKGLYIERKIYTMTRAVSPTADTGGEARNLSMFQCLYIGRKVYMTTRTSLCSMLRSSNSQSHTILHIFHTLLHISHIFPHIYIPSYFPHIPSYFPQVFSLSPIDRGEGGELADFQ